MHVNAEFRSRTKAWLMIDAGQDFSGRFRVSEEDVDELLESINWLKIKFSESASAERRDGAGK